MKQEARDLLPQVSEAEVDLPDMQKVYLKIKLMQMLKMAALLQEIFSVKYVERHILVIQHCIFTWRLNIYNQKEEKYKENLKELGVDQGKILMHQLILIVLMAVQMLQLNYLWDLKIKSAGQQIL